MLPIDEVYLSSSTILRQSGQLPLCISPSCAVVVPRWGILPSFSPPRLLGLEPLCPYQLYGVHLAYICYHSLRLKSEVLFEDFEQQALAVTKGCGIARHLTLAYLGKTTLKFSPSSSSSPSLLGARQIITDLGGSPPPSPRLPESSYQDLLRNEVTSSDTSSFALNLRLRMSHARRTALRSRGVEVASGPIFSSSSVVAPSV